MQSNIVNVANSRSEIAIIYDIIITCISGIFADASDASVEAFRFRIGRNCSCNCAGRIICDSRETF